MMQRFVAFDPLFTLGFDLVFKAISSFCAAAVHDTHSLATAQNQVFPRTRNANLDSTPAPTFIVLQISAQMAKARPFWPSLDTRFLFN
jgi:hypothetical protein